MDYKQFIESKKHTTGEFGFDCIWLPDQIFDFQKHIIRKAIRKGRMGIFADTGLGKTRISLSIAENIVRHTGGKVLILTPLAVAFQFIEEAKQIGIESIEYSKEGEYTSNIVLCNYERLHYFNPGDFEGVILDESSILKNFKGEIKIAITSFMRKIKYRFLTTATPSPNDFIELGTSSEALGYMGYMDMLSKFFKTTQNDRDSNNRNIGNKFRLLAHAEKSFFEWVNSWSIMVKKPSDLGDYDNTRYTLPDLVINMNIVENFSPKEGQLFYIPEQSMTMSEVREEQKKTEYTRCVRAVELAKDKLSVYRCNTNNESEILKTLDPEAVEIIGSQTIDKKEQILKDFADGKIKRLITKASITGMGLNWQHCNHCVYFPTRSYEQYYQAIRRFWRFGQKKPVIVDMVYSSGQERVMQALQEKTQKAIELYQSLIDNVQLYKETKKQENTKIIKPIFIK